MLTKEEVEWACDKIANPAAAISCETAVKLLERIRASHEELRKALADIGCQNPQVRPAGCCGTREGPCGECGPCKAKK